MKTKNNSGLTLVELLVVVVIIVILVGLIPIDWNHGANMENARSLKIGNNGRYIVSAIIAANEERNALGMGDYKIWPTTNTVLKKEIGAVDYAQGVSETYFADLIESEVVKRLSWTVFSGGGIGAARNEASFRDGGYNVWSYVGGLSSDFPGDTPFIFTKNFQITTDDFHSYATAENLSTLAEKFDASAKPFGNTRVVFVTTGGAMLIVKQKFLRNPRMFFGNSILTNSNITVVHPK